MWVHLGHLLLLNKLNFLKVGETTVYFSTIHYSDGRNIVHVTAVSEKRCFYMLCFFGVFFRVRARERSKKPGKAFCSHCCDFTHAHIRYFPKRYALCLSILVIICLPASLLVALGNAHLSLD